MATDGTSHWLLDGKKDAPVIVYVFADRSAHIVNSSGSRLARGLILESAIKNIVGWRYQARKPGDSAAILAAKDPAKTWQEYEASGASLS